MRSPAQSLVTDLAHLEAQLGGRVRLRQGVLGSQVTTFALGGPLAALAEPQDNYGLRALLKFLEQYSIPWRMLGAGSNVVIPDSGLDEVVIRLGAGFAGGVWLHDEIDSEMLPDAIVSLPDFESHTPRTPTHLLLYGAASLMSLSRKSAAAGLSGFEFAAGIPASIGGAIVMNAGAHGHSFSESCESVIMMSQSGDLTIIDASKVGFGYRETHLPDSSVVIGAVVRLVPGDAEAIRRERTRCLEYRKKTQPLHLPSAGSVFANPSVDRAAAQVVEACGFKGVKRGGVAVSEMHANWIVKLSEQARAEEVRSLIDEIREDVYRRHDILLRPEIRLWEHVGR